MSDTSLLASVAAAAAATATPAIETPAPPAATASTTATAAPAPAASAASAETPEPAPSAGAPAAAPAVAAGAGLTARTALELTALAYPTMAGSLTKLAIAADGGETAFRQALLAERGGAQTEPVSTAQTRTAVTAPGAASKEGRGAGLVAAAAGLNPTT